MGGKCSTHGQIRNAYGISVGESEEKILIGRPRHKWEDTIKLDRHR
jgi:hypothetical protein